MKRKDSISKEELPALVSALSKGSVEAYSTIYRSYYPRLYRYAMQLYPNRAVVEDVLQDFFTYLAENCRKTRKIANFETYLFQSVKRNLHSCLSRQQQIGRTQERYQRRTAPLEDQTAAPPDEKIIVEETAGRQREQLKAALAELPDHQREILYLRYYEEMSYQEICQVLDLKYQVARNYASRAIKQLKKVLWDKELLFSILYYCFNLHR